METYEALDRAVATTGDIVKNVRADQMTRSTPCTAWDVRSLLNHITGALALTEAIFTGGAPPPGMSAGGLPDSDVVGDDPLAAYTEAANGALAAVRAGGALDRVYTTPLGEMPGHFLAGFITQDVVVHGWDVARATGQEPRFGDGLIEHVTRFARQAITDETRAPFIAAAVPVPATAPALDRLIGHFGREP